VPGSWKDITLACRESRPPDPARSGCRGSIPNTEHDCGFTRTPGLVIAPLGRAVRLCTRLTVVLGKYDHPCF
jgi:hypothetical protein